jgi:tetratricopeptide (TPR) repeat protein
MEIDTNIFAKQELQKRDKRNKVIIITATVLGGILLTFLLVTALSNLPAKKEPVTVADPSSEVMEKVNNIAAQSNRDLSEEDAAYYLAELDALLAKDTDAETKAELHSVLYKIYLNSGKIDEAMAACEDGLALNASPLRNYLFNVYLLELYDQYDAGNKEKILTAMRGALEYDGDDQSAEIDRPYLEERLKELTDE